MKKLTDEQKAILIYSGELFIFSILFIVLGILKLTGVMAYKETRRIVFNWITVFGSCWGIADFIWAVSSKKRQKRISMVDKILVLPLSIFIMTFDLISLINKPSNNFFYVLMIAIAFFYAGTIFMFESIYHYFKPIPGLLEELEEEKKEQETNDDKENSSLEENNK